MTRDPKLIGLIEGYLDDFEGHTPLPDATRDAIRARLPSTPQRPAWWPGWRFPEVDTMMKYGLGAASAVLVALVGFTVLGGGGGNFGSPDPTDSAESAAAARALPDRGSLAAGQYRASSTAYTPVMTTFVVPEGWAAHDAGAIVKDANTPGETSLSLYVVTHVYEDACQSAGTLVPIGPAPADLVTALLDQRNIAADGPIDMTVDGHSAQRVDLAYPPRLDTSACRHPGRFIQVWADSAETSYFALRPDYTGSVYAVDAAGQRVVITADYGPEATEADIAEVDAIIRSVQFDTDE